MDRKELEEFRKEIKEFYEDICKTRDDNLKEKGKYIMCKTKLILDFLENQCYVERQVIAYEKPRINNAPGLFSYLILKITGGNIQRTIKKYERAVE